MGKRNETNDGTELRLPDSAATTTNEMIMAATEYDAFGYPKDGRLRCGFCYPREQFQHGEIKSEWFECFRQFVPLCRKHSAQSQCTI